MKDFQERVVEEKRDLDMKIGRLGDFLRTETYTALYQAERTRLQEQIGIMRQYSDILGRRIEGF